MGFICLALFINTTTASAQNTVHVTIGFTNDLHSQFSPERDPLGLGGMARIKTAMDEIRRENPNSLLVDAGDWSEGTIYYSLETGAESLRMMDLIGYDMAVVGNHDYLNGPDALLDAYKSSKANFPLLGANFGSAGFSRGIEWQQNVRPYAIRNVGGAKIAFIGITAYEFIYDKFVAPVTITPPVDAVSKLVAKLSPKVDAIIVLAHIGVSEAESLLNAVPELDLVITAHDHKKLTSVRKVSRLRGDGFIVEAEEKGHFLGRIDLEIPFQSSKPSLKLLNYGLKQIDSSIAEDQVVAAEVKRLNKLLENRYGNIFSDQVAEMKIEANRIGSESVMGNLLADSYLHAIQADAALEQINFVPGDLYPGTVNTVDIYNANSHIYNQNTEKTWTLHRLSISGQTMSQLLNLAYSSDKTAELASLSTAGISMIYDPIFIIPTITDFIKAAPSRDPLSVFQYDTFATNKVIKQITINGRPLRANGNYRIVIGGGIVDSIKTLNKWLPNAIPVKNLVDTGIEDWQALRTYISSISPVTKEKISMGTRLRSLSPDLAVTVNDIQWKNLLKRTTYLSGFASVTIQNLGATPSMGNAELELYANKNAANQGIEPSMQIVASGLKIKALAPMEKQTITVGTMLPLKNNWSSLTATIISNEQEVIKSNNQATLMFKTQ